MNLGEDMEPRLKKRYREEVVAALLRDFKYSNVMMVPRLQKVVLNTSIKEGISNVKILEAAADELTQITGQKAIIRRAKKSIAPPHRKRSRGLSAAHAPSDSPALSQASRGADSC